MAQLHFDRIDDIQAEQINGGNATDRLKNAVSKIEDIAVKYAENNPISLVEVLVAIAVLNIVATRLRGLRSA